MTKGEFMRELGRKLSRLPENEKKDALEYYYDYFAEAGIADDMLVPPSMESPEKIAKTILADYDENHAYAYEYDEQEANEWDINEGKRSDNDYSSNDNPGLFRDLDNGKLIIIIIAAVILSPAILGTVTGVAGTLLGIIIALAVIAIVFALVGVAAIASAFVSSGIAGAILLAGIGVLFLAIAIGSGLLLGMLCGQFIPWGISKCVQFVKWVFGNN